MNKPITWKKYRKLHRDKKIHTKQKEIKENGVLLFPDDLEDLENENRKMIRIGLKELFDNFLENNF